MYDFASAYIFAQILAIIASIAAIGFVITVFKEI